jgi:hypothetical protein
MVCRLMGAALAGDAQTEKRTVVLFCHCRRYCPWMEVSLVKRHVPSVSEWPFDFLIDCQTGCNTAGPSIYSCKYILFLLIL